MEEPLNEIGTERSTRKDFLKKSAAGAVLVAGVPMWARPAGAFSGITKKPLKIGFFMALTGPLAQGGIDCKRGFDLYLKAHRNHLAGRPVQVTVEDDGSNPSQSLAKVRKLTEQDKVTIIVGGINAASGPPVFNYVNSVGMPWINPLIATDELTQKDKNSYMIRTGTTASHNSHYFGQWLRQHHKNIKNVGVIAWDFLFGYQNVGGFQDVFQRLGGAVTQKTWVPLGTPDMSPFLSQLDTSVDAVYAVFGSADAGRFLNQYFQFGYKQKLPLLGNWTLTDETVLNTPGLPDSAARGILTDGRYCGVSKLKLNYAFQRLFNATYHGESCSNNVCDGWVSAQAIEAALKKRSDTTNRRLFAAAFKGIKMQTPRGPVMIDNRLEPVEDVFIRRVDKAGKHLPPGYFGSLQNTPIFTYKHTNQFWKFPPARYIQRPSYSRDYPPVHAKK